MVLNDDDEEEYMNMSSHLDKSHAKNCMMRICATIAELWSYFANHAMITTQHTQDVVVRQPTYAIISTHGKCLLQANQQHRHLAS